MECEFFLVLAWCPCAFLFRSKFDRTLCQWEPKWWYTEALVENEGDIGVKPDAPYSISYGSLLPQRRHVQNLLVSVALSSTHIAFGSIRMEPVFMILGQSAGAAACLAIDRKIPVQDIAYGELKERLLDDGQIIALP